MKTPTTFQTRMLCSAILLALSDLALAQTVLPEVQIKAQTISDAEIVIGAEDLEKRQAKDLRDTFQNEAGMAVGGGGNPITQKVYVRGIEENMMNVTMDGARQGGSIYHHQSRIQLDPSLVKSIEVDKGTSGATTGPGALAGSIRVTTKDAKDMLRPGQEIGASLGATHFSNSGNLLQGSLYGKLGSAADLLLSTSRQDMNEYKDGRGDTVAKTATLVESNYAKANLYLAPGHKLTFSVNQIEDSGTRWQRPHMTAFAHPAQANNLPTPQTLKHDTFNLGYRFDGAGGVPAVEINVFHDTAENMRFGKARNAEPATRHFGEAVVSKGVDAKLTSRLGAHTLRYGINHHEFDAKSLRPINLVVNNHTGKETSQVTGVFLEDEIALGEKWLWTLGGRYDSYKYTDNKDSKFDDSGFSPSTRLTFSPSKEWNLHAGHARALRGVGLQEVYYLDNTTFTNSADIKAEKAANTELGADYTSGPWQLKAAVFRQVIDDYISINLANQRDNVGKLVSKGYELGVVWQGAQLRLAGSIANSNPKLNGDDLNDGNFGLGTRYGRTLNFNAEYAVSSKLNVRWNSRFVGSIETVSGNNANYRYTKEGYHTHDLAATWKPLPQDQLTLTLGIYNLFDRHYYDQASYNKLGSGPLAGTYAGFAEPGRNVRLSANWKF